MDQNLLSQLRDIEGLDSIHWWPPAPGWWALAFLITTAATIRLLYRRNKRIREESWQAEAKNLLAALRSEASDKKKAAALSELLRRHAVRTHGRESCAGLEGKAWLEWLEGHDPAQFSWRSKGKILIEAPYAPEGAIATNDMEPLIEAAERWIR